MRVNVQVLINKFVYDKEVYKIAIKRWGDRPDILPHTAPLRLVCVKVILMRQNERRREDISAAAALVGIYILWSFEDWFSELQGFSFRWRWASVGLGYPRRMCSPAASKARVLKRARHELVKFDQTLKIAVVAATHVLVGAPRLAMSSELGSTGLVGRRLLLSPRFTQKSPKLTQRSCPRPE